MSFLKLNSRGSYSLIITALLTTIILSPVFLIANVQAAGQPWWNTDWQYRKSIEIDNTANTKTLTNYPVSVSFDAGSLISAGKMKSDLSDLRLVDSDGSTVLNYWIESMPTPGQPASSDVINWKYTSNPLSIPTYDYPNVVHPKMLYFPEGYDNYKFWMFYEPYGTVDVIALARSNDGTTWTGTGVTNPILSNGVSGTFDSWAVGDPTVIIVGGTWYLFFDGSDGSADRMGMATSTNGLTWTKFDRTPSDGKEDPVLSADINFVASDGHKYESANLFISPSAYNDGSKFWVWLDSGEGTRDSCMVRTMLFSCTDPTASWTRENGALPVFSPTTGWEGNAIWHSEVTKHGNEYWMYYCAPRGGSSIGFAKSTDKVTWARSLRNPILTPVAGTWEGTNLYQSSCIEVDNEIWLFYSAYGTLGGRIGLAKALPTAGNPNAVIQVKIPSVPATSKKTIYMYYGNPSSTAMSNGENTFSLFDDFNDNSLNAAKWQTGSGTTGAATPIGSVSETNQHLEINEKTSSGGTWVDLYAVTKSSFDFSNGMSFKVFMENLDGAGPRAVIITLLPSSTTNSFLYNQPQWIRFIILDGLYYLQVKSSSTPTILYSGSAGGDLNRVVEIQIDSTKLRCLLDGVVYGTGWYTHGLTWTSAYAYLEQSTGSANSFTTVHDNMVIRNYIPPEPATSLGLEEMRSCTIQSCDSDGATKDRFLTNDIVYATGSGYSPSKTYNIYVVGHGTCGDGGTILPHIVSQALGAVPDTLGTIKTSVWSPTPTLTPGKYDIIVDVNGNGKYDTSVDAIDNTSVYDAGFFVIPEYALGTILAVAMSFAGVTVYRQSKRNKLLKEKQ